MNLIVIENDLFDIAWRVKAIDENYYVVYNPKNSRYEVHNKKCRPSLSMVVEGILDVRVIKKLRETHISRLKQIIEKIERTNREIEANKDKAIRDEMNYKAKQISNYLSIGGSDLPRYKYL